MSSVTEQRAPTGDAIVCRGLVKRYADVVAVAGIDLNVRRGECFGLLGPNGAGKTTTIEILEGLKTPDEGEILLLGRAWGKGRDRELREAIGIALQETEIAERLTVEEIVRLFRSLYAKGRGIDETIRLVDLEPKRKTPFLKLSGGQRQRLALACALVGHPEILFLDEPTTGLDPQARHRMWEVVTEFKAKGGTVLLTTHYMDEAARLCDRLAIIDHGKIIAAGTPKALVADLQADQIIEFEPTAAFAADGLATLPGVHAASRKDGHYVLRVQRMGLALPALLAAVEKGGAGIKALATHEPTLEDVFVHLTGRALRDD
ncbi:MAG: ABC transporter ATP-binding protein [Deltaproteobacteria bacterium]|nr:ABC transporter ATP-binding protein [Deltaproteobacteria bacterium]